MYSFEDINDLNNNFNYKNKNDYDYQLISKTKNKNTEELKFNGINKKDQNISIYIKEIKLLSDSNNKYNKYMRILKIIFFLILLIKYEYLEKVDDMLYLDDSNGIQRFFFIFKDNSIELSSLIYACNVNKNEDNLMNYLNNKDLIKWIIYQITFGLFTLHKNNIIHNDIKPSNILINCEGGIKICISGSMNYKTENSYLYTRSYASPEFLNDEFIIRDEKSDMWSLGVIILELFLITNNYFKINNEESEDYKEGNKKQLNYILSKFSINENLSKEELNKLINEDDNSNGKSSIKLTKEEIEKINDENALELINNLLVLNKNKRFSAEQVLKSKYLEEHLECFKQLDLPNLNNNKYTLDMEKNYNNYFSNPITNKEQFEKIYNDLLTKLKELNKSQ